MTLVVDAWRKQGVRLLRAHILLRGAAVLMEGCSYDWLSPWASSSRFSSVRHRYLIIKPCSEQSRTVRICSLSLFSILMWSVLSDDDLTVSEFVF
ncbi:unnamed protein product [Amoebophrya sp. A25]|nr:unnamed protein product [Amoebophrya sp. A25]|eukprot:GSA25T00025612001.1